MKINSWFKAARLRTLPLAATCVLLGGALAKAEGLDAAGDMRFGPVVLGALVTVSLLQILANFANDYGDFSKGTDVTAGRLDRALASGDISPSSMKKALVWTALLALLAGLSTLAIAFVPGLLPGGLNTNFEALKMGTLGVLGVAGIASSIRYT